ncbi:LysR family transcriptional regulator [Ensifer sp. ENS11]|uniref:LysR family transcriptional regulator n=1 Tax=Ensifer sp. ENS11 TaxID=2769291 RepID=UPI0017819E05|nr:LysR family transcriptional regulator [Ensifer sp. ENS11]MBD9488065.1 LysR family transcriptional regulator [Ensifer sp. ENS11]
METKQLSYFVLACQYRNHAEAAADAGMSSSALSENISQLEQDLGIKLFQRGPLGHYPTEAARWLYQRVEPILQRIEAAEDGAYAAIPAPARRLEVSTPLQFTLGRLSRAISLSVRYLRKEHPQVIPRVRFDVPIEEDQSDLPAHVAIRYGDDSTACEDALLYRDDWIAVTNHERAGEPGRSLDFDALRRLLILVPPLLPAQRRLVRAYCAAHDLPEPIATAEDVGTFPYLSRETRAWAMLAPRSLVAVGASRLQLDYAVLPVELSSPVVAHVTGIAQPARTFVDHLQRVLSSPPRPVVYDPRITLRQMRYFLALMDQLNVTAAARKLHVVQPALSSQLRKLEATLGVSLFERQRTGLKPLADAHGLAGLFREGVEACDQLVVQANRIAPGDPQKITIGVVPLATHIGPLSEALAAAISEWTGQHAAIKLQLVEAPATALHRWVEAGEISFAIVETQVSRSSQLDLRNQDRMVVVTKSVDAILPPGDVELAKCTTLPLILPSPVFGLRQLLDQAAESEGLAFAPDMEINSIAMILALVRRMRLATILPETAIQNVARAEMFQLNPIGSPSIYRRLSIVFSTDRSLTDAERGLVDLLKARLADANQQEVQVPLEPGWED